LWEGDGGERGAQLESPATNVGGAIMQMNLGEMAALTKGARRDSAEGGWKGDGLQPTAIGESA